MKRSKHTYKYGEIVIGHCLDAVTYAYDNHCVLVVNSPLRPDRFDRFAPCDDTTERLTTSSGTVEVGQQKLSIWKELCFDMSLAGQIPISKEVNSIRVGYDALSVVFSDTAQAKMEYGKLTIFDDTCVVGINPPRHKVPDKYKVMDWYNVRSGAVHEYDLLEDRQSDLVREVYFYPSERIDGKHNKKDLVAVSYLNKKQLMDIEYSDLYSKYKTLDMMGKAGIKGASNGRNSDGSSRHLKVKIELNKRELKKVSKNIYDNYENITFVNT